jgi:hypothetical protein
MIVMFAARRLKPRARKQFRPAWDAGDALSPGFHCASHARNVPAHHELIDTVES